MIYKQAKTESKKREGAAMIEFAVILPFFIALLLGIIEMGSALHASQRMLSAARGGARLASMDWTAKLSENETPNQKVIKDIRNFLKASGLPGDSATIEISHAEGDSEGSEFDLADEDNELELFRVSVSIPHDSISMFPNNVMGSRTLLESVVQRAGRSTLSN